MKKYIILILSVFLLMSCVRDIRKVCIDELPAGVIIDYEYNYHDILKDSLVYQVTIKTPTTIRIFMVDKQVYNYLYTGDTITNSTESEYFSEKELQFTEDILEPKEKKT